LKEDRAQATRRRERLPLEILRRLSLLLPLHLDILAESAQIQRYLFAGEGGSGGAPLWMLLLRRDGGLRQVSGEWLTASDALVSRAGLAASSEALAAGHPPEAEVAYRLGLPGFALSILAERSDSAAQVLRLRIAVVGGDIHGDILDLIKSSSADESTALGLLALHLVHAAKRGRSADESAEKELERRLTEAASSPRPGNPAVLCHVANSLNFLWSKRGEIGRVEAILAVVEKELAPRIDSSELMDHVMGNARFHRSMLSRRKAKADEELEFLLTAARLDHGFTDYDYRIAQILHDRGDAKARGHYEAAL
jgi:hypothetical protein